MDELSPCCGAHVTFSGDGELYCKKCFHAVDPSVLEGPPVEVKISSEDFIVSKPASQMRPGDRFIFSEEMGGEGEVVTVVSLADTYGIAVIETEELDFAIEALSHQWLTLAPEEELEA